MNPSSLIFNISTILRLKVNGIIYTLRTSLSDTPYACKIALYGVPLHAKKF